MSFTAFTSRKRRFSFVRLAKTRSPGVSHHPPGGPVHCRPGVVPGGGRRDSHFAVWQRRYSIRSTHAQAVAVKQPEHLESVRGLEKGFHVGVHQNPLTKGMIQAARGLRNASFWSRVWIWGGLFRPVMADLGVLFGIVNTMRTATLESANNVFYF